VRESAGFYTYENDLRRLLQLEHGYDEASAAEQRAS
jgi:hypothetical protein